MDFKLSEPVEGACWKVKYTVDMTEMKFVVEVRPCDAPLSFLEVSTDCSCVPRLSSSLLCFVETIPVPLD